MAAPPSKFDNYKLETEFRKDCVVHTTYEWEFSTKRRKESTWRREKQIGAGAFGSVWLEKEDEGGNLRAVKKLFRGSLAGMDFSRELHAHLFVEFFGWYENRTKIFLAMEYIEYGDLSKYISDPRKKAKREATAITRQILEGLEVLHGKKIYHRDLKPQRDTNTNDCRTSSSLLLIPFGLKSPTLESKRVKDTALRTICGTTGYHAPELPGILSQKLRAQADTEFTHALDMWSLGWLVHEILTSQTPFLEDYEEADMISGLTESDFQPAFDMDSFYEYCQRSTELPTEALRNSQASEEAIDFVKSLLVVDPNDRPTAARALHDPWIKDGHTSGWFESLEIEFSSLGVNLDLGAEKGKLIRQIRKTDIMRFLPISAKEEFLVLLQQAAQKGYHSAAWILIKSRGSESIGLLTWGKLLQQAAEAGKLDIARLFLTKVNVNARADDRTVLQWAVEEEHLDAVKLLLENFGANTSTNSQGLLQRAIGAGNTSMAKLLLDYRIDANAKVDDKLGRTPLQMAAERGDTDMVRLLLSSGADTNTEPSQDNGRTALQVASGMGHIAVVKLLLDNKADVNAKPSLHNGRTALQAAAGMGHIAVVMLLLDNKADVNAKPSQYNGRAALQAAAGMGHIVVVKLLLDNKADINAKPSQYNGRTALQAAAGMGHIAVVMLLLDNKADINAEACPFKGRTALQAAAEGKNVDMMKLLLDKGADVNAKPSLDYGQIALQAAARQKHIAMVKLLIENKADVNVESYDTKSQISEIQKLLLDPEVPPTTASGSAKQGLPER